MKTSLLALLLLLTLLSACDNSEQPIKEDVVLRLKVIPKEIDEGSGQQGKEVFLTISNSLGEQIFSLEGFDVSWNGSYYSTMLSLEQKDEATTYTLEQVIVTDGQDTALYLSPREGSLLAAADVSTTLPQEVDLTQANDTLDIEMEVLSSRHGSVSDFGYDGLNFTFLDSCNPGDWKEGDWLEYSIEYPCEYELKSWQGDDSRSYGLYNENNKRTLGIEVGPGVPNHPDTLHAHNLPPSYDDFDPPRRPNEDTVFFTYDRRVLVYDEGDTVGVLYYLESPSEWNFDAGGLYFLKPDGIYVEILSATFYESVDESSTLEILKTIHP